MTQDRAAICLLQWGRTTIHSSDTQNISRQCSRGGEHLAGGTGCKAYVHKWWICWWLRPWFSEPGPDNRICMVIFSLGDRMPLKGVRQLILRVTFTLLTTCRWKTLQPCSSQQQQLTRKTHHIFKAPKCLHGISMTGVWINHSHLCPVDNRELHLNSTSQTARRLTQKRGLVHRADLRCPRRGSKASQCS